jgi:hypothetical protein
MRRAWLHGRENLHKRYLIHVAGKRSSCAAFQTGEVAIKGLNFHASAVSTVSGGNGSGDGVLFWHRFRSALRLHLVTSVFRFSAVLR